VGAASNTVVSRDGDIRNLTFPMGQVGPVPRISVIVPTYQRGPVVTALVAALCRQREAPPFELIVVIDGSTDDTATRLAALATPFPMRVLYQANAGLANARNRGAAVATGEILLFLDDDMEPDQDLLAEHHRSHEDGSDVVSGAVPLHADSATTFLADGAGAWAEARSRRLGDRPHDLRFNEIVSGQVSIRRDIFARLGGFDERFTAGGTYGNEDLDLGYRLLRAGCRVTFNARALSRHRYVVTAEAHLRQYEQAGRADVTLARKYPELVDAVFNGELAASTIHRLLRGPVLAAPRLARALARLLRSFVVRRVDAGRRDPFTIRAFFFVRAVHYWAGVHAAGGIPRHDRLHVLCYHAISDLGGDAILKDYGVPPKLFRAQLESLRRAQYRFIHPDELARFVSGEARLPRRAVLVTFDDCYRDLLTAAAVLRELDVPAIAFVVSGRLGRANDWDRWLGAGGLTLLSARELVTLPALGIELGAHSRTHPQLPSLSDQAVHDEVDGCVDDLRALGLPRPRFFSYPHGEHDDRVRETVRAAGFVGAFTTAPGRIARRTNRYALHRIEIFPTDLGWRLRLKLRTAGPLLHAWRFVRRVAAALTRRYHALATKGEDHRNQATRA